MVSTEEGFVELLRQKDRKAYEDLYERYSAAMYGVGLKMLGSEALAQDALQETFITVWKKIHTYDPSKGRLFTWMLRIMRNKCRDFLKKKEEKYAAAADRNIEAIADNTGSVEEEKPKEYALKEMLEKLPGKQGVVLNLIYFGGMTHVEAADYLKMPLGTVKSNVRLGMKHLRKLIV